MGIRNKQIQPHQFFVKLTHQFVFYYFYCFYRKLSICSPFYNSFPLSLSLHICTVNDPTMQMLLLHHQVSVPILLEICLSLWLQKFNGLFCVRCNLFGGNTKNPDRTYDGGSGIYVGDGEGDTSRYRFSELWESCQHASDGDRLQKWFWRIRP